MADKSEWKTPSMEGEGKGDGHQYERKPRTPEPIPIADKLRRKRWDIGLLRALNPRIMMMMMIVLYLYIYIVLLAVHTNKKSFQCERPKEKKAVLRERKEALV